jgi:hypothetical protein
MRWTPSSKEVNFALTKNNSTTNQPGKTAFFQVGKRHPNCPKYTGQKRHTIVNVVKPKKIVAILNSAGYTL